MYFFKLINRANKVPVGLDQKQHIELTRDYAERFNQLFSNKGNYFELPEYVEAKVSKVMSLKDGNLKMSKSERNDNTRINIDDEPELIFDKIRKAKTDSLMTIKYEINRPEMANLIRIYSDFKEISISDTEKKFFNKNIKDFKEELAETIVERFDFY